MEKQLSEQKAPPEVIIPGKGTFQPVRVNQAPMQPSFKEQFTRTALDPKLIQSGIETGATLASNPRVQQLVQNALQAGVEGISSASKLISK